MKKENNLLALSKKMMTSEQDSIKIKKWNPPFFGEIDMRILTNGQWLYKGALIHRTRMTKLFATVLRKEIDNCYYLVTPVEKFKIKVDDVPFIILNFTVDNSQIIFHTNMGDNILLKTHSQWRLKSYGVNQTFYSLY